MSNIFVILYETPRSPLATGRLYYQHRAVETGPLPAQPETNTHFIARHRPTVFGRPCNSFSVENGPLPTQPATNTHFVARLRPTTFARFPYNSWSIENGPLPTQPTTDPHFVGRYRPTAHSVLPLYRSNVAADFSSQTPFETNVSFIARHAATAFRNPLALRTNIAADFSTPQTQPETNPHFLARPWPSRFALLPALRQQSATDAPLSALAETNTHFIGRFTPPQHRIFRHNYTGCDFSTAQTQPETNVHFLARPWPSQFALLPALRQQPAIDVLAETNTHFIGRFTAPQHRIFRNNYTGSDFSTPQQQPETNVHYSFLGTHRPTIYRVLVQLRSNAATDFAGAPPADLTELHFTRFFADVGSLMSR